jgi:hypothetical protein
MNRTPYQTYLTERLQSARSLGWEFPVTPEVASSQVMQFATAHPLHRFWSLLVTQFK